MLDEKQLDQFNMESELSIRRAKRMLEFIRTVYMSEAALLNNPVPAGGENLTEHPAEQRESLHCREQDPANRSTPGEEQRA